MPKRACDACRRRKVKCDEREPACAHCGLYNVPCTYTMPQRRRGPRPRWSLLGRGSIPPPPPSRPPVPSENSPAALSGTSRAPTTTVGTATIITSSPSSQEGESAVSSSNRLQHPGSAIRRDTDAFPVHEALLAAISRHTGAPPEEHVSRCIDVALETSFSIAPMYHELNFRAQATLTPPPRLDHTNHRDYNLNHNHREPATEAIITAARAYCMTTSFCAIVGQIVPAETIPHGKALAASFAQAAESVLGPYSIHEIASPTSDSINMRYWLAGYHHLIGNVSASRYYRDQAMHLVHEMRLWDEASYGAVATAVPDPIERKLRRIIFWHSVVSDMSTALLNHRPQQLNEFHLREPITASLEAIVADPPLVDPAREGSRYICEEFIVDAFKRACEVWILGAGALAELRLFMAACARTDSGSATGTGTGTGTVISDAQQRTLRDSYMRFISVKDNMPACITSPGTVRMPNETKTRRGLWTQRANILLTYKYLHMLIICQFAAAGYTRLLGVAEDATALAWRKIEIAHGVLEEISSLPFEALQLNGEPAVEKLRYICAVLLDIIQQQQQQQGPNTSDLVADRAKWHFTALLDVISRLDSRVSARLVETYIPGGT